ncbi:hypothetical protein GCM10027258_57690 [Amycolatopsis stemonae]
MTDTPDYPDWLHHVDTVPCPSWCRGRHPEVEHPEDRRHMSDAVELYPMLAEGTIEDLGEHYGGVQHVPVHLIIGMDQGFREVGPQISITPENGKHGPGVVFTVDEADRVARTLRKLVKQARGGAR